MIVTQNRKKTIPIKVCLQTIGMIDEKLFKNFVGQLRRKLKIDNSVKKFNKKVLVKEI